MGKLPHEAFGINQVWNHAAVLAMNLLTWSGLIITAGSAAADPRRSRWWVWEPKTLSVAAIVVRQPDESSSGSITRPPTAGCSDTHYPGSDPLLDSSGATATGLRSVQPLSIFRIKDIEPGFPAPAPTPTSATPTKPGIQKAWHSKSLVKERD